MARNGRTARRRARRLCVAAAALALAGAADARADAPTAAVAPALTVLSNGSTLSRWAYTAEAVPVHGAPARHARVLGSLRYLTTDGQAELYLVLASLRAADGTTWLRIELPGRPNGLRGWVPATALGPLHVVHDHLLVDRGRLRATLYRDGRAIFSAPVGVGKPSTATPGGDFYVLEKLITIESPVYGPYAIGTSAYAPTLSEWPGGGVVGIHGTNEPQLIPGRPSHGCIRMRNGDIARLWHIVEVGTPIRIE